MHFRMRANEIERRNNTLWTNIEKTFIEREKEWGEREEEEEV